MTLELAGHVGRALRGIAFTAARIGSRVRRARIRLMNPSVRFVGPCFVDTGVRVIATRGAQIIIRNCHIGRNVVLEAGPGAAIDLDADFVGPGAMIVARTRILVGAGSKIAEMVVIRDADHDHSRALRELAFVSEPVTIGADVWIGSQAVVLKGVEIGDHATVAAAAVVTRAVASGTTVGGIPARPLLSSREETR